MHASWVRFVVCASLWATSLAATGVWMVFPDESQQSPAVERQIAEALGRVLRYSKPFEVIYSGALRRVVFWRIYANEVHAENIRRTRFVSDEMSCSASFIEFC